MLMLQLGHARTPHPFTFCGVRQTKGEGVRMLGLRVSGRSTPARRAEHGQAVLELQRALYSLQFLHGLCRNLQSAPTMVSGRSGQHARSGCQEPAQGCGLLYTLVLAGVQTSFT